MAPCRRFTGRPCLPCTLPFSSTSFPHARVGLGFAFCQQALRSIRPNRVHLCCGPVLHLLLLSTWPRGHAVAISFGPENVCPVRTCTSLLSNAFRRTDSRRQAGGKRKGDLPGARPQARRSPRATPPATPGRDAYGPACRAHGTGLLPQPRHDIIGSTGQTEASSGGVHLARDSRPGVRRMIVGGGRRRRPPSPLFATIILSIPPCLLKTHRPMARVLKAPALILHFRLNQYSIASSPHLHRCGPIAGAGAHRRSGRRPDSLRRRSR
jgi:hypothetical protein